MSDKPIEKMTFEELRNEVRLLSDSLAKMKRFYEDAFYNLDDGNFSKTIIKEKNGMKAQIKVMANAIKTMVSDTDLQLELEKYSTIEQTADEIELAVVRVNASTDEKLEEYSTITQTAETITETVTKNYIDLLIGDTYVTNAELSAEISLSAEEIALSVSQNYETKSDASDAYDDLDDYISRVALNANGISTRVTSLETFKTSVFTQTSYGFTLDGDTTTLTGVFFLTDDDGNKRFEIYHDESQGYEQIIMGCYPTGGLPIHIGRAGDTLYFSDCSNIIWGNNAPVALFG